MFHDTSSFGFNYSLPWMHNPVVLLGIPPFQLLISGWCALSVARTLFQQASGNKDQRQQERRWRKACSAPLRKESLGRTVLHSHFHMGLLGPNIATHSEYSSEFHLKRRKKKGSDLTFWYEVDLPELSWAAGSFPLPCSLGTASLAYLSANYPWAYIPVLYETTNVIYLIVFHYSYELFNIVTSRSSIVAYAMKIVKLVNKCFRTAVHFFLIRPKCHMLNLSMITTSEHCILLRGKLFRVTNLE